MNGKISKIIKISKYDFIRPQSSFILVKLVVNYRVSAVHFFVNILEYIPFIKLLLLNLYIDIVIPSSQGDSGGPLMCQLPGQDSWTLFGITSWGRQCAAVGSPGVHTRVVKYIDWIQNILDEED